MGTLVQAQLNTPCLLLLRIQKYVISRTICHNFRSKLRIEHVRIFADIRFEMEDDLVILTFEFRMLSSNTFTAGKTIEITDKSTLRFEIGKNTVSKMRIFG